VPARVLPAPSDVALAGWKLLLSGELLRNIWSVSGARHCFLIGGASALRLGWRRLVVALSKAHRHHAAEWRAISRIWR